MSRNHRLPGAGGRGRARTPSGSAVPPCASPTGGRTTTASSPTTTWPSASGGWPSSTPRRPGRQPMRSATAGSCWSSTARSTTTSSWPSGCRPRRPAAQQVGGRGAGRDVRLAGQGRGAPAARHVRVRHLGPANRELFCARDPFGIKPLFYALTAGGQRPRSRTPAQVRLRAQGAGRRRRGRRPSTRTRCAGTCRSSTCPRRPPWRRRPGAAARARAGRPAGRPGRRVPVLAARAAPGPVPVVELAGEDPGRAARLGGRRTCAATCRSARSCPAGWTRPRCARSPPRRLPDLLTFTVGFEREGYSEIDAGAGHRDGARA